MAEMKSVKDHPFKTRNITEGIVNVEIKERLKTRIISTTDPKNSNDNIEEVLDVLLCGINMMNDRDEEGISIPEWNYRNYSCIDVPSCLADLVIPNRVLFDTACPSMRWNLRRRVHYDSNIKTVSYNEYYDAISRFGILAKNYSLGTVTLESLNITSEVSSIYKRAVCNDWMIASVIPNDCSSGIRFPIWIDDIFGYAVSRDRERIIKVDFVLEEWVRHFKIPNKETAKSCINENN